MAITLNGSGITSANIADGTIASADLASGVGGKVLQVVSTSSVANTTTTSTSWVDTNLTLSITPSSTSSNVRVDASCPIKIDGTGVTIRGGIRLLRGSVVIWNSDSNREIFQARGSSEEINTLLTPMVLDSPSTTSAVTYKVQMAISTGVNMRLYQDTSGAKMLLTEIAG